jgi:predicted aspartyl protease
MDRSAHFLAPLDRRRLTGSLLAGALLAGPARAGIVDVHPPGAATRLPDTDVYVPPRDLATIADIYKRMTTAVFVNGEGPFAFVVDTGANQSVLSQELATRLGLPLGESRMLNGVAGVAMTPTTTASLRFGELAQDGVELSVLPGAAIGSDGMLGLDRLGGAQLTLDFHQQLVTVGGPRAAPSEDQSVLNARRRDGQLTLVNVSLAGVPVTAFIDSGAQDTVGNMALRQMASRRYPTTTFTTVPIISVTGQTMPCEILDLPGLKFGSLTLPSWPVAFADLHVFTMWNLIDRPAILLGIDVMSRFQTVCLDFQRSQVRFTLPRTS